MPKSEDDDEFIANDEEDQDEFQEEEVEEKKEKDEDFEEEPPKKKQKNTTKKTTKKKAEKEKDDDEEEKPKKKTTKKTKKGEEKETKEKKTTKKATGKEKKATTKDLGKIEDMLLEYIQKHNRPHAVQSLITAFQGSFTKTSADKALASLCKKGEVTLKQSGKAKVYYVAQKDLESVSKEELATMDEEIKEKTKELREKNDELKEIQKHRDEIVNALTNEQLVKKISTLKEDIQKKKDKLALLQNTVLISDEEMKKIDENLEKYLKEWKKRKSMAKEMLGNISEMKDKRISEVMEEMGLEDDQTDINKIGVL